MMKKLYSKYKCSFTEEMAKLDFDLSYDYDMTDSLQFPIVSTTNLYDKIRKHYLKICVPEFLPQQTNCPKKNWQKLLRLQSNLHNQSYYLVAKHTIGKHGRTLVVSSPLQVKKWCLFKRIEL